MNKLLAVVAVQTVVILTLPTSGCTSSPQEDKPSSDADNQPLQPSPDSKPGHVPSFTATIEAYRYDRACSLLSLRMQLVNSDPEQSVFLVAQDFSFVDLGPIEDQMLAVERKPNEWIFDVSFLSLTSEGVTAFEEMGALGDTPTIIEVEPRTARQSTYVFQFPLQVDYRYSIAGSPLDKPILPPSRPVNVCLRIGYGLEPVTQFLQREGRKTDTVAMYNKRIVENWQRRMLTNPVEVDFSKSSPSRFSEAELRSLGRNGTER